VKEQFLYAQLENGGSRIEYILDRENNRHTHNPADPSQINPESMPTEID
jgi:hypothetical protein